MSLAWNSVVRFLTVLAALIALAATTASAQPTPTPGEALFVVSGRGWGHGVGMSQYGAYGMALEGRTHAEILKHFYTGTQLGRASSKKLRVLLAEGRKAVTISSAGAITARDASGTARKVTVYGGAASVGGRRFDGGSQPRRNDRRTSPRSDRRPRRRPRRRA